MSEKPTTAHELVRELVKRARELGWEIETNWRDEEDGQASYDLYVWQDDPA